MLNCPVCKVLVREDRIEKHISKVHPNYSQVKKTKNKANKFTKVALQKSSFMRVYHDINGWSRIYEKSIAETSYCTTLAVMFFEIVHGYSFEEINHFLLNTFKKSVDEIKYLQLVPNLRPVLREFCYTTISKIQQQRKNFYIEEDNYFLAKNAWYECNTIDPTDGSKYLGYERREYEDSQFGSYPIHDDYGDESWPD